MSHEARQVLSWLIFNVGHHPHAVVIRTSSCMRIRDHGVDSWRRGIRGVLTGESLTGGSRMRRRFPVQAYILPWSNAGSAADDMGTICRNSRWRLIRSFSLRQIGPPNQAPEPTPGLVTPRAPESTLDMKRLNRNRDVARGAPSPGVAHL
jgi:hypothetical protein